MSNDLLIRAMSILWLASYGVSFVVFYRAEIKCSPKKIVALFVSAISATVSATAIMFLAALPFVFVRLAMI